MAEKEYIERDAALAFQNEVEPLLCRNVVTHDIMSATKDADMVKYLQSIPAADVRPVVLCRDCRDSYEWSNVDGDSYRYCGYLRSRWNHDIDRMVDDDDYCKWGQKREES